MTVGVAVLRALQAGGAPDPDLAFGLVTASAMAGIVAAATTGWVRMRRVDDRWRRGVTGAVSVFGAVLLAVVATPVDTIAGLPGVLVYLAALVAGLIVFHRLAARAAAR